MWSFFHFRIECHCLNELCCQAYNGHQVREFSDAKRREVLSFRKDDKIMATRNNDVPVYGETDGKEENGKKLKERTVETVRLMNGSVYMIKAVGSMMA